LRADLSLGVLFECHAACKIPPITVFAVFWVVSLGGKSVAMSISHNFYCYAFSYASLQISLLRSSSSTFIITRDDALSLYNIICREDRMVSKMWKYTIQRIKSYIEHQARAFNETADMAYSQQAHSVGGGGATDTGFPRFQAFDRPGSQICTVTSLRNPAFIGRDEQLNEVYAHLVVGRKPTQLSSCAIQGSGGVGKTQTALEFTYRYRHIYNAIFWVNAERTSEIQSAYGAIGRRLRLFDTHVIDQPEIEMIQEWLQTIGLSF